MSRHRHGCLRARVLTRRRFQLREAPSVTPSTTVRAYRLDNQTYLRVRAMCLRLDNNRRIMHQILLCVRHPLQRWKALRYILMGLGL